MSFLVDTNIFIRSIINESTPQAMSARKFLTKITKSKEKYFVSTIVLIEIHFTLKSFYKFSQQKCTEIINTIAENPLVTIIDTTHFREALKLHNQTHVKLTDCLIATQIPKNCTLVTFDQDFDKIPKLKVLHP